MSPDDPRHGTYAGAIQHWKDGGLLCEPCRFAARRTTKKHRLDALEGRPGMTVLGRAHEVIVTMPRNQLVAATGIKHRRMKELEAGGPEKRVHRRTRDRILAAGKPSWTPVGIQRRIQALTALGWSLQALGDQSEASAGALGALRRRENPKHVRLHFAEAVLDMYDELSMALPPTGISATETRNEAARRGYAPPLAWDDENIDDPAARPAKWSPSRPKTDIDPVLVERIVAGDMNLAATLAEKHAVVAEFVRRGLPLKKLEDAGWKPDRYLGRRDGAA